MKIYLDKNNATTDNLNKINAILVFCTNFKKNNLLEYLEIFIKKIKKKSVLDINKLEKYMLDDTLYDNITPLKYINLLTL